MLDSGFRFWVSKDYQMAVAVIFDNLEKSHMFTVNIPAARASNPSMTLDEAIYTIAVNLLNGQT